MRVTSQSQALSMRSDLASAGGRLADIQRQVASGKVLRRASDGPAAALEALRYRRSIRSYGQYDKNITDSKAWLGTADNALQAVDNRLTRAHDLTVQAENGSLGSAARTAIAAEIRSIADELVGIANTRHLGRPIFAGTSGVNSAYAADGSYQGDSGLVMRTVSSGVKVQVNANGPDVFGATDSADPLNGDMFQVLSEIADRVDAGTSPSAGLDSIKRVQSGVRTVEATLGSRVASIESLEARNRSKTDGLNSALSRTEDVDLTEAIMSLKGQEASYQATLGVSGRILSQSLLDFLR